MENAFFTGACTALVTPFLEDRVNYPMLEQLLRYQMEHGIQTIVICGTTGEAPTLSDEEKINMFRCAKAYVGSACKIIAGTGSNCTSHALRLSKAAEEANVDGLLVVSPYYNKATPEGLVAHYKAIAEAVHIPLIAYNVPSRTGVDMPVSVYRELSKIPNIAGVKEASTDMGKLAAIRETCPDFTVWSGNDDLCVAAMSLGAKGIISVASNVAPVQVQAMARAALDGDFDTASDLQIKLRPLIKTLFSQVNPIPVKAAMKCIGFDCGGCRLPLTSASEETIRKLKALMD